MARICDTVEAGTKIIKKVGTEVKTAGTPGKRKKLSEDARLGLAIVIGAALFVTGEILERLYPILSPFIYTAAYLVLGGGILLKAGKNIMRGQIFDENLLMSIATLGAFAIGDFAEAVGVMLFFRVGEYFEHRAVEKSRGQIMDAVDMRPEIVSLVMGDDVSVIPAGDANVGDILLVRPGDRVPLDGVVIDGESRIDTSPVTGEPVPVGVGFGSEVISGCVNTSGALKIRVEKVLEESMVTRILDSVENAAASKPKIDRFITRFARVYTPIVLAFALLVAVVPSLITGNWSYWVYTALTFLVISCPCALVLSVPLAFYSGIGAGSKKGILFKGCVTLEALKNIKTVVMDKTGTITKGNFVVHEIIPANGMDDAALLALAASCESQSTHPIAGSIMAAAQERGLDVARPVAIEEIAGQGVRASTADSVVLCGNRLLLENNGISLPGSIANGAGTEVYLAKDGFYEGYLSIADTVKDDAKSAVSAMKRRGLRTAMLTGDTESRAHAVADETGVDEVHAKLLPGDKVAELQSIRDKNGAVLFVGDGINDAPVLAAADVGAAMGSGADAAIEVADVVYMTSSLEAVPQSLSIADATCRIAMQNVVFALAVKAVVMALGLMGYASMWMAVFADTGVSLLCVLNSIRILYKK
jgi:Cd2+/Zn2+-exporting ATPase